jgi:hypothetical protein
MAENRKRFPHHPEEGILQMCAIPKAGITPRESRIKKDPRIPFSFHGYNDRTQHKSRRIKPFFR